MKKRFVQTDVSKRFIEMADELISTGAVRNYKQLGEEIGLDPSTMSSIINGRINIPYPAAKSFEEKYNSVIINISQENLNSDLWERILRLESIVEAYEPELARLMVIIEHIRTDEVDLVDFMEKVSELRLKVSRVSKRRLDELPRKKT